MIRAELEVQEHHHQIRLGLNIIVIKFGIGHALLLGLRKAWGLMSWCIRFTVGPRSPTHRYFSDILPTLRLRGPGSQSERQGREAAFPAIFYV